MRVLIVGFVAVQVGIAIRLGQAEWRDIITLIAPGHAIQVRVRVKVTVRASIEVTDYGLS